MDENKKGPLRQPPVAGQFTGSGELLIQLQQLSERDLTRDVIEPLLLTFGFSRIDSHGGPYEGGKDVIAWRTNELGEPELAVVQVKLGAPSARADSSRSFAGLLTQLQQAAEQPVQHIDGKTYLPTHIYFFTPEPVDTRTLQTRFEAYQSLRHRGIKIVDGHKLAELLARNCPQIAERLLGHRHLMLE
jgi:hypothetical protein